MKYVDEACEKMGVRYNIMFGTLLGAVRHRGFIPWDDDIDICMLRSDYDRFIAEGNQYLPEHIRIQHCLTEEQCPNIFAKVRDKNTTFLAAEHVQLDINHGVFIDVFPVDFIDSSARSYRKADLRARLFQTINNCYDDAYVDSIQRKSSKLIAHLIRSVIIKGFLGNMSRKEFILREDHHRSANQPDEKRLAIVMEGACLFKADQLEDRVQYDFEGTKLWGPKAYDEILSRFYGDYMKLPPDSQRVTHKPLKVDLEHGYTAGQN